MLFQKHFHSCYLIRFLQHPYEVDIRVEGNEPQEAM